MDTWHRIRNWSISIHASHAGRDEYLGYTKARQDISIHASHAGGENIQNNHSIVYIIFNPRVPWGRRRLLPNYNGIALHISIHASHAGRDVTYESIYNEYDKFQSTRPMRDATLSIQFASCNQSYFNPRVPCGTRRFSIRTLSALIDISIHASHAGRDVNGVALRVLYMNFNPRVPCGTRLVSH